MVEKAKIVNPENVIIKQNLPFKVSRVGENTISITPKIKGLNKRKRIKIKGNPRICEIIVVDNERIKSFDAIHVSYPNYKKSLMRTVIDKVRTTANNVYKK